MKETIGSFMPSQEDRKERDRKKAAAYRLRHPDRVKAAREKFRKSDKANSPEAAARARSRSLKYYQKNKEMLIAKSKSYYLKNLEKKLEYARAYAKRNRDKLTVQTRAWNAKNPEKRKEIRRKWQKSNTDIVNFYGATRRATRIMATPPWVNKNEIIKFYTMAAEKTAQTGISHHVDHIYPLRGNGFAGLHVPWNLQILTESENCSKGNRYVHR